MSTRLLGFAVLMAFVAGFAVKAAEEKTFSAKCVVAGDQNAKEDKFADYKGGKVYFCCDGCKGKFTSDPAKYAVSANGQLVATGQAKQVKCPLAGKPCNKDKFVEVKGIKVYFCCDGCKGKVAAAKGDEQAALVFSDDAFSKGFEVPKKK
jgi:YHS domain-containing protein